MECFAVKSNCLVLRFTFLPDRCKALSSEKYGEGIFIRFSAFCIHIAYGVENKRFAVKAG